MLSYLIVRYTYPRIALLCDEENLVNYKKLHKNARLLQYIKIIKYLNNPICFVTYS